MMKMMESMEENGSGGSRCKTVCFALIRKRAAIAVSLVLPLFGLLAEQKAEVKPSATPAEARSSLKEVETSKLDSEALLAINRRDHEAAIPLLEELCIRLSESKAAEDLRRHADLRYQLGMSAAIVGDYPRSAESFARFITLVPQDGRVRQAREFRADSLFYSGSYDEAAGIYQSLTANRTTPLERIRLTGKLADCYVAAENWEKALPVVRSLLQEPIDEADRQKNTILLLRGLIALRQFDEFFERFPILLGRNSLVASSLPFNAALIDAGETLLSLGQPSLAIPVFRSVRTLPEIREALKKSIEQLRKERSEAVERREPERAFAITGRMSQAEALLKTADAETDYTAALSLRLMRAYAAANRPFEAFWTTRNAFYVNEKDPLAEVLCLSALRLATLLHRDMAAIDLGLSYLADFPSGKVWDEVGVQLAQLFLRVRENEKAISFADRVLATKPDTAMADQLILTRGLARLNLDQMEAAKKDFQILRSQFADKDTAQQALYWTGVANLRLADYAGALGAFDAVGKNLPPEMALDVPFRRAVALFGLERYEEVVTGLSAFLENGAPPRVATRARMLLADAYGALGRLDDSYTQCQKAVDNAMNQGELDEATFMACQVLEKMQRFPDLEHLLDAYLAKYKTSGDFAQAYYLRAMAQRAQGVGSKKILDDLWQPIRQHAYDPSLAGIDRLLNLYVDISKGDDLDSTLQRLNDGMIAAKSNGERAAELRFARSLTRAGSAVDFSVTSEDLEISGPETLLWIATILPGTDLDLSSAALLRIIDKFPDSDAFPPAALEQSMRFFKKGDYFRANAMATRAIEAAPLAPTSARAYNLKGDILMAQHKYGEAIKEYESILQVREWRGELWPEALYKIGDCHIALKKPKEAYAYFQRIYVLYSYYKEWTAKSYLRCAEISRSLGLNVDAIRTLKELLADKACSETKEYADAKKLLESIQ